MVRKINFEPQLWLLVGALFVLLVACSGPAEEGGGTETAEPTAANTAEAESTETPANGPIRIGGLVPLSSPGSVVGGEAMRDAMQIAVEELNERGGILGRPVELLIADTEGLPERGTAVMETLINEEGVVAVVGGFHSSVAVAAKEVAHENGIPIVIAEASNDTITSVKYPEVFRLGPLSSEVSAIDVAFISSLPDIKKVVIITENTDYGIPAAEDTTIGLAENDIQSVTFGVDLGTEDFAETVDRVIAEEPDMIMVLTTGTEAYKFQQQAAEAGIGPQDIPMLCSPISLDSETFWTNVPDGLYCFVHRTGLPEARYTAAAKAFVARYIKKTGKQVAESYAMEAYDAVMLLAQAIEEAETTEPTAVIEALETISYDGALGTITFPYGTKKDPAAEGVDDKFWHQFPDPAITIVQYQETLQDSAQAPIVFPEEYKSAEPVLVGR